MSYVDEVPWKHPRPSKLALSRVVALDNNVEWDSFTIMMSVCTCSKCLDWYNSMVKSMEGSF